jgi:hypothetical protein
MAISTSSTKTLAAVLYHAQVFNPKRWDTLVSQSEFNSLIAIVDSLFEDLERSGIPYVLVGGIAMLVYVEGRNTEDIDLILHRPDLNQLNQMVITEENRDFARAHYQGLQVDLLLTQNPLFGLVQQHHTTDVQWGNRCIPCATPQGLVVLKLYALPSLYRQGQFDRAALYETDILQLAYHNTLPLEPAIKIVDPHVLASDRAEIREIAKDIEQRLQRMRRAGQASPTDP